MPTVELLLDDYLDATVRQAWAQVANLGVASLAGHTHPTNRPHVTLAAGPVLPALGPLPLPIPVTLEALLWLGRGLAWQVTPSPALLALHQRVWQRMADPNPLHAPGAWVPHVSLARRVPPGFSFAVEPHCGHLVKARSYDSETRTVHMICP